MHTVLQKLVVHQGAKAGTGADAALNSLTNHSQQYLPTEPEAHASFKAGQQSSATALLIRKEKQKNSDRMLISVQPLKESGGDEAVVVAEHGA